MSSRNTTLSPADRRSALFSACLAAGFAVTESPEASAAPTSWTVNTCNEASTGSGTTGSLRYAVGHAASGDIVDMSGLTCSTISLQTGAITVAQNDLKIVGPGADKLTITGKYNGVSDLDRIFDHQGTGTLSLEKMTVEFGYLVTPNVKTKGGCIYSKGNVYLADSNVYLCEASFGGGVFTAGDFTVKSSTLGSNIAYETSTIFGRGGAAYVEGTMTADYVTIKSNIASGFGGGLLLRGSLTLNGSTVSGNTSDINFAGIDAATEYPADIVVKIVNSTISSNNATGAVGGLYTAAGTVLLQNSTIAFNTAGFTRGPLAAGMAVYAYASNSNVTMESSILSNNSYSNTAVRPAGATRLQNYAELDFSVTSDVGDAVTISSTNNLIRASTVVSASGVVQSFDVACPLLGPLRDNGGPTFTHALLSHSPAIDMGNNLGNFHEDQRGGPNQTPPYLYPRVSGSAADIGAYEVQQADVIFNTAFEECLRFAP
jgi:hypothetical protein